MTRTVTKPWGEEIIFAHTERYAGKILKIKQGGSLSLQYHVMKEESLFLFEGTMQLTLEVDGRRETRPVLAGEALHFQAGTRHRMEATTDCVLFEVSTPELDDVVRLEDRYGRV